MPSGSSAAESIAGLKARAAAAVEADRAVLLDLSHRIHEHPEPAYEERLAAGWIADLLRSRGFVVEQPAGRLETAIRATYPGRLGRGGPRIGVLAEYDALPGLGHGCGHNTMAASGTGAALALAAVADALPGEIVFLGTPAEERGSGKNQMLEDGLFAGLDAALLYHPCDRDHVDIAPLASEDVDVTFTGEASHASASPWDGRNALDALVSLFASIGLLRQQLRPDARIHGIVLEGGSAANIIPDRAAGRFMIRSADDAYLGEVRRRFRALCDAAALGTDTRVEVVFSGGSRTMRTNRRIAERWMANAAARGIVDAGHDDSYGSTDMTSVSWSVPSIHPDLSICEAPTPGHTIEFRDAARSPKADATTLLAATLVAETAIDLFLEPGLVEAAWREFRGG